LFFRKEWQPQREDGELKLIQSPSKEPCSAKLRYTKDMLRDLRRLVETLEGGTGARLSEMVARAEQEAGRQLKRVQDEPQRRPAAIAVPRPRVSAWERVMLHSAEQNS
jgi:hypothetical protein